MLNAKDKRIECIKSSSHGLPPHSRRCQISPQFTKSQFHIVNVQIYNDGQAFKSALVILRDSLLFPRLEHEITSHGLSSLRNCNFKKRKIKKLYDMTRKNNKEETGINLSEPHTHSFSCDHLYPMVPMIQPWSVANLDFELNLGFFCHYEEPIVKACTTALARGFWGTTMELSVGTTKSIEMVDTQLANPTEWHLDSIKKRHGDEEKSLSRPPLSSAAEK